MSWKEACSDQLDFPHVAPGPVTQHMESPYGESKGTDFFEMSPGLQQQTMPFSSKVNPVQLYQQVQYSRAIKERRTVIF